MTDQVRSVSSFLALLDGNNQYANPKATTLTSQLARDLIASLSTLVGVGVLVDGVTYPFTTAGVQAAHNSLPATGGTLIIPPNSPIQGSYTTLLLNRPNLKVIWPKSSPLLAPTGGNAYILVQVGTSVTGAGLSSLLNADALHGLATITVVSTAGFAAGDYVQLSDNLGQIQINRVQAVNSATVLRLYRPISAPLTTAAVSVCAKLVPFISGIEIEGLHISNNGNSNPGLITGWAASQQTTITGNVALGATSLTLTSATGFANGDYILIRDSGKLQGEGNGWVTQILNLAGAVVTTNGGLPFALSSATTQVFNVGAGGSVAQLQGNVGLEVTGCDRPIVRNFTASLVNGSAFYSVQNYEPEYHSVIPFRSGFPYNGTNGPYSAAVQSYYDMAPYWENCYAEFSLSWGAQLNFCSQPRGELGSINAGARGVKLQSYDGQLRCWSEGGRNTGVAVTSGSCFNVIDVQADANMGNGLWLSNQANTDNYVRVRASGNGLLGGNDGYDVQKGLLDLRTVIEVLNEDAVITAGDGIAFTEAGIKSQVGKVVTYAAGLLTASAGTFTVAGAGSFAQKVIRNGYQITVMGSISAASVSGTPLTLRIALPTGYVIKGSVTARCTGIDNNTELTKAIVAAEDTLTYLKFYVDYLSALGTATNWNISAALTYLNYEITFEVE